MVFTDAQSRTPSSGYVLFFLFAAAGVLFVTVALVGAARAHAGADPLAASVWPGQTAFAASFLLLFASRLVFWSKSSPALQQFVRAALTAVLLTTLVLAAAAVVLTALVLAGGRGAATHPVFLIGFAGLAALSHIGTIVWLRRYRRE